MAKDRAARYHKSRRIFQLLAIYIQVFIVVHLNWKSFRAITEGEGDTVIVRFHPALLVEGFAEDSFASVVMRGDVSMDLREGTNMSHLACLIVALLSRQKAIEELGYSDSNLTSS
jgi:hypothetical protein